MRRTLLAAAFLIVGLASKGVLAGSVPYSDAGTVPQATQLVGTGGDVVAYFAGSTAAFSEQVAMYVDGVLSPAGWVFPNHDTANGFSVNLGHAAAGSQLVFGLQVYDLFQGVNPTGTDSSPNLHYTGAPSYTLYSVPAASGVGPGGAYQFANPDGSNHAYISDYVANQINGIPVSGTYVAFEDLLADGSSGSPSDFNFRDEQFVFTGVRAGAVPEPASIALVGIGALLMMGYSGRKLARS